MMIFSSAPFLGPVLGPLLSGFINYNQPHWRWTYYVIIIWSGTMVALIFLFVPETFDAQLLRRKAKK
jgi:MFS family permease